MISHSKSKVCFFFENVKFPLSNRIILKNFIETLFRKEKKQLHSLNYIFCTDKQLLEINKSYLNHDFYTDIITFDLSEKGEGTVGEIYISIDRVRDNAKKLGCSFKSEIHRVIFHGALHLCGFKDKMPKDKEKMRGKEDDYLRLYNSFHVKQ